MSELSSSRKIEVVNSESSCFSQNCNRWAVIVGISKYRDNSLNLRYADRDAEALYRLLLTPSGGQFKEEFICKLTNRQATTGNITQALRGFLKKPAREDVVIIYFACHGAPDPDRPSNVYLLTYDTDPKDIAGTALLVSDINRALRDTLHSEKVVLLADTCHSAAIGGSIRSRGINESALINRYLKEISTSRGGVALLTSAEANEVSFEDEKWGGGHGVFTYYLLQGLSGAADVNNNGFVTVGELFEYVREHVKQATNHKQHPSIGSNPFDRNLPLAILNLSPDSSTSNLLTSSSLLLSPGRRTISSKAKLIGIVLSFFVLFSIGGYGAYKAELLSWFNRNNISRDDANQGRINSASTLEDRERQRRIDESFETAKAFEEMAKSQLNTKPLRRDHIESAIESWQEAIRAVEEVVLDYRLSPSSSSGRQLREYQNQLLYTEALEIGLAAGKLIHKEDISTEECEEVKQLWQSALDLLQKIPSTDSNYEQVEKKKTEYKEGVIYAVQKKIVADFRLAYYIKAPKAAKASQSAQSSHEWTEVASLWYEAWTLMENVPTEPEVNYNIAKERVKKYQENQTNALVKAGTAKDSL